MRKEKLLYDLLDSNGNIGEVALVLRPLMKGPLEKWVLKVCIYNQSGVSVRIPKPEVLINISLELGLVKIQKNKRQILFYISNLGMDLLEFKHKEKDRLTKQQGQYLFSIALKKIDILNDILSVINIFNKTSNGDMWINKNDKRIDFFEERILRFFQQLKIAQYRESNILIEKKDARWLLATVSSKFNIDIENLLNILAIKRKYGMFAEEFVMQEERARLIGIGRNDLARLVKKIGDQNIAAGYDILSYDGLLSGYIPDRFIEVKGTSEGNVHFYITKNELEVAKKMRDKYWIYCVLNVGSQKKRKIEMINNPSITVYESKKFKVEPVLWRVWK